MFISSKQSRLEFNPFTIKEYDQGRWLTMDAGDVDGDGDEDIVLGSLVPPYRQLRREIGRKAESKSLRYCCWRTEFIRCVIFAGVLYCLVV